MRHAPSYSNETITNQATLIEHLEKALQDTPDVSFELEFTVLQDAGYTKPIPEKGDVIPTILEELGVDIDLKIMEIEKYPNTNRSPKVALGSVRKDYNDKLIDYQKSLLDKIWDENKKAIRYNVYDESVKRATEMLNKSLTELEYPEGMGIIARDPNDPNKFVAFRSSGIGITSDGGLTFDEAITTLGVTTSLLTAGQIKTNNIQIIGDSDLFYWDGNYLIAIDAADPNKFVRLNSSGLYIAKGALTIERPDGYKIVDNGLATFDMSVQERSPYYLLNASVINQRFATQTNYIDPCTIGQFSWKHTSRYLKFEVALATEFLGGQTRAFIELTNNLGNWLGSVYTENTIGNDQLNIMTIDLGTPTGAPMSCYFRLKTNTSTSRAFASIVRYYLSDF